MGYKMKTNMRRLSMVISTAVILVIAVGIIAKLWLIPTAIKKGVTSEINKSWPGRVYVEEPIFYFKGRVTLGRLLLKDNEGRNVLQLKNTKAFLPDISRLNFKVRNLEVASAEVDLFPPPAEPETKSNYVLNNFAWLDRGYFAIEQLNIEDISIRIHSTKDERAIYDNLQLSVNKSQNSYHILLSKPSALDSQIFSLKGVSELSTYNSDFDLSLKTLLKNKDVSVILSFLGIDSSLYSTEGYVNMTARFNQNPQGPDSINLKGAIDFDNWQILCKDNLLLQNLYAKVVLDSNRCEIQDIRADICQGTFGGSLALNNWMKRNESFYTGQISGKQVDLSQLSKCMDLPQKLSKGTLSFEYSVIGYTNDLKKLAGEGIVFINDSDLYQLPVISHVFAFAGLKANNFQKATDAMVLFRNAGSVVTIDKGQVANRFWAIRVVPGGYVDVQNKTVDMHVVVIPLGQIEDIVRKLPFAELFGKLKDKLTRLKVKGKWSDPASKLVTKEPLTDVKEATVSFIRDVVDSGGQITEKMRKPFKEMLDNKTLQK
jgi:hypothetical protein